MEIEETKNLAMTLTENYIYFETKYIQIIYFDFEVDYMRTRTFNHQQPQQ